jgi:hypothetical protein
MVRQFGFRGQRQQMPCGHDSQKSKETTSCALFPASRALFPAGYSPLPLFCFSRSTTFGGTKLDTSPPS